MAGQHRTRGGRVTPKGGGVGRLTPEERRGLEDIFAKLLGCARNDLRDGIEPLEVEMWASHIWSIWEKLPPVLDTAAVEVFAGGFIAYCARRATPEALAVLLALGAVAPQPYGSKACRAAQRLAQTGMAEPSWSFALGGATAVQAWLSFDPVDDDGVSVIVGFEGAAGAHTLGVYVDHNLAGIAKDSFAVPATIGEVLRRLKDGTTSVEYREISLAEAGARWQESFQMADLTGDSVTTDDLRQLRALLRARLATLPVDRDAPREREVSEDEREHLLEEFLASAEVAGLGDVEDLAFHAMSFSLDYVVGTPLRFSPVMVEIFSLDWAPRKLAVSEEALAQLPEVLSAWIRFVGRRRGIPGMSIDAAVDAVYEYAPEMIALSRDPTNWGPAKTIALAVRERGIDITDQAAMDEFIAEVNRVGGIDVLAGSLVGRR